MDSARADDITELLVGRGKGARTGTALVGGGIEGVLPEADGVADPVGVDTPLGPEVTDVAPLGT